jgi:steroid delta-isomerase
MPSQAEMKATMQRYVEVINAGDLEGVLALFADDATVEDPVGGTPQRGMAEIREFYAQAIANKVRLRIVGPQRGSSGNAAAMPLEVEVVPSGAPKMLVGVIEIQYFNDEGKIVAMQAYWGPEDMTMSVA